MLKGHVETSRMTRKRYEPIYWVRPTQPPVLGECGAKVVCCSPYSSAGFAQPPGSLYPPSQVAPHGKQGGGITHKDPSATAPTELPPADWLYKVWYSLPSYYGQRLTANKSPLLVASYDQAGDTVGQFLSPGAHTGAKRLEKDGEMQRGRRHRRQQGRLRQEGHRRRPLVKRQ